MTTLEFNIEEKDLIAIALRVDERGAMEIIKGGGETASLALVIENYIVDLFAQAVGVEEEELLKKACQAKILEFRKAKKGSFKKNKSKK